MNKGAGEKEATIFRKYKPYPAYKDSGVGWLGEVPKHWDCPKLKRIASLAYGDSFAGQHHLNGEYNAYGSNGIIGESCLFNAVGPCTIIGRKGSFGKINYSSSSCFAIDTTFYIDNDLTKSNIRWLYYCLQILGLDSLSKDSAVPGLSREEVYGRQIPYCDVEEQKVIAAFLDHETTKIDALIAKQERLIELLQEKRAALITHAVTKGLDPNASMKDSGVEWLGVIPAHWGIYSLKRVALLKSGDVISSDYIEDDGEFPVYGGNGLRGYTTSYTHDGDHVLIGRQGALCGNINYAYGKFWASEHAIVVHPLKLVDNFWLGELLRVMNLNQYSLSAAQPGIAVEKVCNIHIPVPSLSEQVAISNHLKVKVTNIDNLCKKTILLINKLREYRTALISAAVTGKIDVREEVSSA